MRLITSIEAEGRMRDTGLMPLEPYPGRASLPWKVRCTRCGDEFTQQVRNLRPGGTGCWTCSGKRRIPDADAEAIMRAANYEPLEPYPGVLKPWHVRCAVCGRESRPMLTNVKAGKGCKGCATRAAADRLRRSNEEAVALARERGFEPLEPYAGALTPWHLRCLECGTEARITFASVYNVGSSCARCFRGRLADHFRMPEEQARAIAAAAGLEPLEPYRKATVPWRCRCLTCGRQVSPHLTRLQAGGGCRFCADYGADWNAPGVVYVVRNDELRAFKVGIAERGSPRLSIHATQGWDLVATFDTSTLEVAFDVEQAVLAPFRALGLCPYLLKEQMPQAGYTETVGLDAVDVDQLLAQIRDVLAEAEG